MSAQPNPDSSSGPSSTSSYPPQIEHFTPINSRPRPRVPSSASVSPQNPPFPPFLTPNVTSQAPNISPYLPSIPFPDQRYVPQPSPGPNLNPNPNPSPNQVRYESMYPAPPPHNLPRAGQGMYEMPGNSHSYAPRPEGDNMSWDPEVSVSIPALQVTHRIG